MKINCQLPNHSNEEFDIDNIDLEHTSIEDLKNRIYDRTGISKENQCIEIDNKRLPCRYDKKSLSKLHINESTNLRVVYVLDGGCDCCGCGCDLCGCGGSCRCSLQ